MKPQMIQAKDLTHDQQKQVMAWLKANGCPYMVSTDARIQITGNHVILRTWTIRTTRQSVTLWPKRLPENFTPPSKVRKYRIRHQLRLT